MKPAAIILMSVPFLFASACYLFLYSEKAEVILGCWALCTVACLGWGFIIRRKHPAGLHGLALWWGLCSLRLCCFPP